MMVAQKKNATRRGADAFESQAAHAGACPPLAPLQAAVRSGGLDMLRQLLAAGLDPDERTQIGQLEDQTFSAAVR